MSARMGDGPDEATLEAITRRVALRRLGLGGALLAAPTLLAACGGGSNGGSSVKRTPATALGGTASSDEIPLLRWAQLAPSHLDIAKDNTDTSQQIMAISLEGLLTYDEKLRLVPRLAESWSQPDDRTYVYKIRSGVRFWDGSPLEIDDVVYALARHVDPKTASTIGPLFASVASVKVSGALEVTVKMKKPDPLFQYVPVFAFVTPKALAQKLGKQLGAPGSKVNTMGTGPYKIESFDADTGATLVLNPNYWGERPKVQKVSIKFVTDPQSARLAAQAGEIDGMFNPSSTGLREWQRLRNVKTGFAPGMRVTCLAFNVEKEPWSDVHVRRAVAHAADTRGFVKAFLGPAGQPASALPAPVQWGALASPAEVEAIYKTIPQYPYDLEKAKREFEQSAHASGFTAEIQYPSANPVMGKALVALGQSLEKLGVTLKAKGVTGNKYWADLLAHTQDLAIVGLGPDYVDPANYLVQVLPSSAAVENGYNTANFKDPKVDELLGRQSATTDKAERARVIGEILRIAGEQLPYLPLWWQSTMLALNSKFAYNGYTGLYYNQDWVNGIGVRA